MFVGVEPKLMSCAVGARGIVCVPWTIDLTLVLLSAMSGNHLSGMLRTMTSVMVLSQIVKNCVLNFGYLIQSWSYML